MRKIRWNIYRSKINDKGQQTAFDCMCHNYPLITEANKARWISIIEERDVEDVMAVFYIRKNGSGQCVNMDYVAQIQKFWIGDFQRSPSAVNVTNNIKNAIDIFVLAHGEVEETIQPYAEVHGRRIRNTVGLRERQEALKAEIMRSQQL